MVLAIVQARCSSSRLPGKVLKPILGKPMILHEIERLLKSNVIDKIILATSQDESDTPLADLANRMGIPVFRGNLNDVLDRYYQCAKREQPNHVVRITGDCPLLDIAVIDQVIHQHLVEKNDYTSNTLQPTYPDGLDVEVMRYVALEKAWQEARLSSEREHVTQYIIKHPELFKQGSIKYHEDLSGLRWTVDEPEDFSFVKKIYEILYPQNEDFSMKDILQLLDEKPELLDMNSRFERNEGLKKSLLEDEK